MSFLKHCSRIGLRSSIRSFSSGNDALVDVKTDNKGIATVTMNRPPVNSLNFHLLEALHRTFVALERDKCRGMILTSSSPTVFSAGLDILEMYQPTLDKARQFWRMLQDTWIKLYSTPYPTVAVINGHSPAGGCLLALSCEYRVIVPKVTIGLNETQLGIVAPQWFQDCLRNVIGDRKAEIALTSGHMFTSDEALRAGLVDEIVSDKDAGKAAAEKFLAVHSKIPALARTSVKVGFRKDTLSRLLNGREVDTKIFIDFIFQPKVQDGLGKYLESLKKK
uniref:Enoyl-CoA delta isomerase 1, mitochondrial n=1 Tax=Panstrongylus lignarius TaxID=156445 RepID=A0A224XHI7_9HEMI